MNKIEKIQYAVKKLQDHDYNKTKELRIAINNETDNSKIEELKAELEKSELSDFAADKLKEVLDKTMSMANVAECNS